MGQWTEEQRAALDLALQESEVVGLHVADDGGWCDVLIHVVALTDDGAIDTDPRRVLRLVSPSRIEALLRRNTSSALGPAMPLANLEAIEEFFASVEWFEAMYGWRFFDADDRTSDWPAQLSLSAALRSGRGSHSFYWFNECGRNEGEDVAHYCIEGRIEFERVAVLRADGSEVSVESFTEAARRWWEAFRSWDPAVSIEAQQTAQEQAPRWRRPDTDGH
jgi:hypothetical protein